MKNKDLLVLFLNHLDKLIDNKTTNADSFSRQSL